MTENDIILMGIYAPKSKRGGNRQIMHCNRRADGSIVEPIQYWSLPNRPEVRNISVADFLKWASHKVAPPAKAGAGLKD